MPRSGKPRKMREVTTNFVNLGETLIEGTEDPILSVQGTLVEKGSIPFGENVVGRYKLQDDDDVIITVLGSVKMDDLLENIPVGVYLKLDYIGQVQVKGGFKMKDYKLSIEEA